MTLERFSSQKNDIVFGELKSKSAKATLYGGENGRRIPGFETGTLVYKAVILANTPRRSPAVFLYEHNNSIFTYKQVVYTFRTIQPRNIYEHRFLTVRIEHIHSKFHIGS